MRIFSVPLSISLIVLVPVTMSAEDSNFIPEISAAHESSNKEFADLSAEFLSQVQKDGETREYRLRFWSKDNKYFRLDTIDLTSNLKSNTPIQRMIVRPEGYVIMALEDLDADGAVVDFGPSADGFDRLAGNFFFDSATRHSGVFPVIRAIKNCSAGAEGWSTVDADANSSMLQLSWSWLSGPNSTETTVNLDQETYACLNSIVVNYTESKKQLQISTEKTYDSNSVIPLTHRETWQYDDGLIDTWVFERTKLNLASPPIEVFAIPAQNAGIATTGFGVWGRRIAVFVLGVICLVAYALLRRHRRTSR
jgi:hypothetical protein